MKKTPSLLRISAYSIIFTFLFRITAEGFSPNVVEMLNPLERNSNYELRSFISNWSMHLFALGLLLTLFSLIGYFLTWKPKNRK